MLPSSAQPPLVSVVMPCYNREPFLREAIESVTGQGYPQWELLVVDDGSTDRSLAIAQDYERRFPGRIRVFAQRQGGPWKARNLGLAQAQGRYVCFLDSDDYWHPAFLEKLCGAIEQTGADVCYCGWQHVGAASKAADPHVPPAYEDGDLVRHFLKSCPWPIHAAIARKELVDRVGGFSDHYASALDYKLWLDLLAQSQRIRRVPECLAYYRWHDTGQISSNHWLQSRNAWNIRRDFVRANPALVGHLPAAELDELVDGFLRRKMMESVWDRDLAASYRLSREVLKAKAFKPAFGDPELRHALLSLLPENVYRLLFRLADRR